MTPDQIQAVRDLHSHGTDWTEIARIFSTDESTIGEVMDQAPSIRDFETRMKHYRKSDELAIKAMKSAHPRRWKKYRQVAVPQTKKEPPMSRRQKAVLVKAVRHFKIGVKLGLITRKTVKSIMTETAAKHGVEVRDILGPWRKHRIAMARQEVMYRARSELALSYPQIGNAIGGRDHTTILYGVKAHAKRHGLPVPGETSLANSGTNG